QDLTGAPCDCRSVREIEKAAAFGSVGARLLSLHRCCRRSRLRAARAKEKKEKKSLHVRYSERSTTIRVTSAILSTASPTLRRRDILFSRIAASSTMTITSSKNVSSSGAIAANDSNARRYSRCEIISSTWSL